MALTLIVGGYFILGNISSKMAMVRTIELQKSVISNQAIFDEFEDAELTVTDKLATFVGYKNLDASVFSMLDNLSMDEKEELAENCKVCYYFTYDKETNIVTISAEMSNEFGEIEMDTISGVGFINDKNEIDAVMNIEGESVLLSEMKDAGMIENCGWFSKLIKAVVVTVVVAAVVVVVAGTIVATAGAAAPALVAAGVGVAGSTAVTAGSVIIGVGAGALVASTVGVAAIRAGTAVGEVIGNGVEQVVDKATGAILEIIYKGARYASKVLTVAIVNKLSKNAYFIALANSKDGKMYYTPTAIERTFAVSIMNYNTLISIYTYYASNARSVAQEAGNNKSPVYDVAHKVGFYNHYHLGNISRESAVSHAFFGTQRLI